MKRLVNGGTKIVRFVGTWKIAASAIVVRVPTNALQLTRGRDDHNVPPAKKLLPPRDLSNLLDGVEVNRVLPLRRMRFFQSLQHSLRPLDLLLHRKARKENVSHLRWRPSSRATGGIAEGLTDR